MKERPILFSGPMVRAILAGLKTQTRRVVKLRPGEEIDNGAVFTADDPFMMRKSPYGVPGDRLWVRETWQHVQQLRSDREWFAVRRPAAGIGDLLYAADCTGEEPPRWRPSIHMPRWASRVTLEVTGVCVERLQEISEEDVVAEGVPEKALAGYEDDRLGFRDLWDSINERRGYSWESNPWVWVVEFRKT